MVSVQLYTMSKNKFDCETDAYVVRQDTVAKWLEYGSLITGNGKPSQGVLRTGTLVEHFDERCENGEYIVIVKALEESEEYWECKKSAIILVPMSLLEALLPVRPISERIRILQDQELWQQLLEINVGTMVYVHNGDDTDNEREPGLVRYKGKVSELGIGTFYGVELLVIMHFPSCCR